jgi:hypothetical protein
LDYKIDRDRFFADVTLNALDSMQIHTEPLILSKRLNGAKTVQLGLKTNAVPVAIISELGIVLTRVEIPLAQSDYDPLFALSDTLEQPTPLSLENLNEVSSSIVGGGGGQRPTDTPSLE